MSYGNEYKKEVIASRLLRPHKIDDNPSRLIYVSSLLESEFLTYEDVLKAINTNFASEQKKGKVIYENIQHRFILVKIKRGDKYEILKLNGTLDESIKQGKGSAVESRYEIKATIKGNSLIIVSPVNI